MENPSRSYAQDRITIDPAVCNGKPTIRGKRITVQTILEFLSAGESREEILSQYPSLENEDITSRTIAKDFARNPRIHQCFVVRPSVRATMT